MLPEVNSVSKSIDETGHRYGSLTVLRRGDRGASGEAKWWVQCDCKPLVEFQVSGLNLRSGNTQGCRHCSRKKRIVRVKRSDGTVAIRVEERRKLIPKGTRFGSLVVLRRGPDAERGHTQWWVSCDCGSQKSWYGAPNSEWASNHVDVSQGDFLPTQQDGRCSVR